MSFRLLMAGPKHSFFPWLGFAWLSEKGAGIEAEGSAGMRRGRRQLGPGPNPFQGGD